MNERKQTKSENRKALPKFALTLLLSLLGGGVLGFVVGFTEVFGLATEDVAHKLNDLLRAATPWAIPVTSVLTLGGSFLLYHSAAKKFNAWDGGDENETSEAVEQLLSWVLLLSVVQTIVNLFFMTAASSCSLTPDQMLPFIITFILSCALVIFAQQKVVDLERRMNPEKHGSVYDTKFQKKWYDSCDESERRQIGEASRHAYTVTTRFCIGLWLVLTILGMILEISILPVLVVLLVLGVMQVSYTLECMRQSKKQTP